MFHRLMALVYLLRIGILIHHSLLKESELLQVSMYMYIYLKNFFLQIRDSVKIELKMSLFIALK